MKPTIGVTRCSRLDDYVASVEQAGGRARVLEVSESPRKLLGEIDGLLLTGGGDIDPVLYGEERHPTVDDAEPGRDEFEIDLARRAMAADLPLLAICRGAQVLNVAAGGTLVQDIPSAVTSTLSHSIVEPKSAEAHAVQRRRQARASNGRSEPWSTAHTRAASTAGIISRSAASAPAWSRRPRRPTASSRRSRSRTARSASACSGTRRTSGAPASSRRSSRRSSAPRGA